MMNRAPIAPSSPVIVSCARTTGLPRLKSMNVTMSSRAADMKKLAGAAHSFLGGAKFRDDLHGCASCVTKWNSAEKSRVDSRRSATTHPPEMATAPLRHMAMPICWRRSIRSFR
jgi:hypothetical protein